MVVVKLDDETEIATFFHAEDANDWLFSDDAQIYWEMAKGFIGISPISDDR